MKFVSLHHHSTFSYGDGFGKPEEHVKRAIELGMSAMAFTEHGNPSSHVQAEKAGKKHGLKILFGVEAYTAPINMREGYRWIDVKKDENGVEYEAGFKEGGFQRKWHQTLIAMDEQGYRNLNRIVTKSWNEGFYRWPTVHWETYVKHHKGIIATSGCADSLLACTLLGGKGMGKQRLTCSPRQYAAAKRVVLGYKALFGDRYYLEVQRFPQLERTRVLNPLLARLSRECGVRLVATADAHYPRPEDNEMQKILHAASRKTGTVAAAEAEWEYDIRLTFPLSDEEVRDDLIGTGLTPAEADDAIQATADISDRCNVILPRSEQIRFPLPDGYKSVVNLIWQWLRDGWQYRWKRNAHLRGHAKEYKARLEYEMALIEEKDYCDYFAMVSDCVRWAKDNDIPVGPARGSAAASLVCYLLRITEVDPMMFPTMMFERFIDSKREDLPDIDLDFADDRRDEVRLHLVDLYGADHVGNIGNFGRYRGKNSLDAVARVYQIPKWETKIIKDLVIERSGGDSRFDASLEDTIEMFPAAKAVFEKYPAFKYALRLEGNYERMGVHAAGLVVSNSPITDTCAMFHREEVGKNKNTVEVIAYDKKDAEYLGMLKADFLGLTTMGMISRALKFIGMKLDDLYQVPLDDPETIEAFRNGDVAGIFQFSGRATRLMTIDVAPDTFMEIADINALSRPGPLFSGASATYVDIKHGRAQPVRLHPIVDKYTKHSQYQIIYQEQVLGIIREMGGFPVSKVADIRKIISQKLGEASFNSMREEFVAGAERLHGVAPELSNRIWNLMVTSATYSFNIAHCISYGMLAFWSMWLKVHYTKEFYAAQLSKTADEGWPVLIKDAWDNAEKFGREPVEIRPPDIRHSGATFAPHPTERAVLGGLTQVPGIAEGRNRDIEAWLEGKDRATLNWSDLIQVKGIGNKTIEKIMKWVESDDPWQLYYAQRVLGELREFMKKTRAIGLKPNYKSDDIPRDADNLHVIWMGIPKLREYKDYIEDERARSGKSLDEIMAEMKSPDLVKGCVLKCYDDGDEEVYLRFNRFNFPRFKDQLEGIRLDGTHVVIAQGVKRKGFGINVQVKQMITIDVTPREEDDEDAELLDEAS